MIIKEVHSDILVVVKYIFSLQRLSGYDEQNFDCLLLKLESNSHGKQITSYI